VPLVVAQQLVRFDVPVMILVSLLVMPLGWDGKIGRIDGLLLFAGVVVYTLFLTLLGIGMQALRSKGLRPPPAGEA